MEVTVLAVDDSAAFREALGELVSATAGFRLVGEAASGEDGVRLARELLPDLVLLDDRLGDLDGVATATQLAALSPAPRVVLVTAGEAEAVRVRARDAGAAPAAVLDKRQLNPDRLREVWEARPSV